jgi:membrane-bound lytic murein transglycosylase D
VWENRVISANFKSACDGFFLAAVLRGAPVIWTAAMLLASGMLCPQPAGANPGLATNVGLKASVRADVIQGPFAVPPILRPRVDFWKDIFTKYGAGHSVIHHRDFPQIVFGVIDLSRERAAMSPTAFDAYKSSVVTKTVADVKGQLLELAESGDARTPFQEQVLAQLRERRLSPGVLRTWIEQDLIRTQTGIRERYAEAVRRAWRYLPVMEQIFVGEFGLPRELTRIPFIESSFDYTAYSSVGAAGIWQFMPKTARAHRLVVGRAVDDRRDPLKATRAAAEYLRSAYNSLGAWSLAITSYNHGVGGVRSKVRKAGTDDLGRIIEDPNERFFGFASTNFYPEFLAAVEIFEDHAHYFPDVPEEPPLRVVSYSMNKATYAPLMASKLGIPLERLREANYGLMEVVWRGRASIPAGYTLRVPMDHRQRADQFFGVGRAEQFVPLAPSSSPKVVPVSSGEDNIRPKPSVLLPSAEQRGDLLVGIGNAAAAVPKKTASAVRVAPTSTQLRRQQASVRQVTVRSGDTLSSLAKRYSVRIERIRQLNNMKGSKVVAGQKLLIPVSGS